MTSVAPPTYYFNGIYYNSSFYTVASTSGLTTAKANALYLQKTIPDTTTVLETFSAGISTPAISNGAGDLILTIGTTSSTVNFEGAMRFGSVSSNFGHVLTSNGGNNAPSFKVTNLDTPTPTSAVNLLLNQTTGDAALCATQNSGALNIGCATARSGTIAISNGGNVTCTTAIHNSTSAKGTLNLANGVNATTIVNLAAGATSSGLLSIGAAGRALTMKGSADSNIDILTGTVKCGALTANIIDSTTVGTLTIGGDNCNSIQFNDNVASITATGSISTAGVITTSIDTTALVNMTIAAGQTSGVLTIGGGARTLTGNGGAINIGNGSGAVVNPINIGSAVSKTTVSSGFVFSGTSMNASPSNTGSMAICPDQDFGNLHIGGAGTRGYSGSTTSEINIGNGSTNNFPINIGNRALTLAQTNIGNLNVSSLTKCTGVLSAIGGIKTDTIDSYTSGGTLVLGGNNCNLIQFSDSVQSITAAGALSAAGFTSSAAITNNSALNSPFTGGISAANFSSTLFDTATAGLLKIGGTYANSINIGDALIGASGTVNMHIANGISYLGNIEIGCGNSFRSGSTSINTKGSGGVVIGSATCASIALNCMAKVGMSGGLSTTAITASGALGVTGLTTLNGGITSATPITMAYSTVPTYATTQVGYCGLTRNGTTGWVSFAFKAGGSATAQAYYMVGTTQLVAGGTYYLTYYLSFSSTTTLVRAIFAHGATNVTDASNTTQTAWSPVPSGGGGCNNCGGGIVYKPAGGLANEEFINSTYYQATAAYPYIGLSIAVDNGTALTVSGTYSIGYMRIS